MVNSSLTRSNSMYLCGSDHPDMAATFINVAMMYQDIRKMNTAIRYLQEALKKNERLLGEEHIQTAACYLALAIAFSCMGAFKLSLHVSLCKDCLMYRVKQKGKAANVASAQKSFDILKANPELIQAFQVVATGGSENAGLTANKPFGTSIMGENLNRSRDVDEWVARATTEVRKKAAKKGPSLPVPVQVVPPLTNS
ncbi:hypothetical protein IFM89_022894 [Coptis chinensis]|uniref:Uncharacterized protein n=1 Tax=Coptis chinensis TaxID=261450 RepID=A0A835HAI1_9MAGN|nr:hypothetical protein IFM89_022894 [Coptis chinensis]